MTTVLGPCCEGFCTVYVDGPLVVPVNPDLLTRVRTLLLRGRRGIVLDLSRVSRIDAGALANWSAHTRSPAPRMCPCGLCAQPSGSARLSNVSAYLTC
jgi:ABC-type transporter Mla MlaB component